MMESRIVMGLENAPEAKLIRQTVFVDEQDSRYEAVQRKGSRP